MTDKINVRGFEGEIRQIELPALFKAKIRADLIHEVWRAQRVKQSYGTYLLAGKEAAASGKFRHVRHRWKTLYGLGISRIPRKILTRRGERFYWRGAFIPGTVGGRAAHPPKVARRRIKINKKVKKLALMSAIAATASTQLIEQKYHKKLELPVVIDSKILERKPREIADFISKLIDMPITKKKIRAGKGKARGRKYRKVATILFVTSSKERAKKLENFGFDIVAVSNLNVSLLAPGGSPGRIVVWTADAIEELRNLK